MIRGEIAKTRDFLVVTAALCVGAVAGAGVHELASRLRQQGAWEVIGRASVDQSRYAADVAKAVADFERVRSAICRDPFAGPGIREMQKQRIIEIDLC